LNALEAGGLAKAPGFKDQIGIGDIKAHDDGVIMGPARFGAIFTAEVIPELCFIFPIVEHTAKAFKEELAMTDGEGPVLGEMFAGIGEGNEKSLVFNH
jgi:hypothetical protein